MSSDKIRVVVMGAAGRMGTTVCRAVLDAHMATTPRSRSFGMALLIGVVGFLACYVPARRATRGPGTSPVR